MADKKYSAEDITILEGLDAVRLRPGMYIGSTGVKGLHHILWEIVDNAIDEAANGYADRVEVKLYKDGSASCREDNGRGIPTDIHPKTGVSGVEVVFTQLHAGGKFDEHNYSFSGGLHGVGASVTNALSEWLKVEVYRGTVYTMSFHSYYDEKKGKYMSGVPEEHLKDTKQKTDKKGTLVRFKPDPTVFDSVNFNFDAVSKRLKELAFLNKGLEINLVDERVPEDKKPIVVNYKFDGGLHDFAMYLNEGKTPLYLNPIGYKTEKEGILIEFAMQHTGEFTESLFSFVNNIPHARRRIPRNGLPHGPDQEPQRHCALFGGCSKTRIPTFWARISARGLTAILSIKMKNVQFEGQTKTKLGNAEARVPVETATVEGMNALFAKPENKPVFEEIIKKAQNAARVRICGAAGKGKSRAPKTLSTTSRWWENLPPARARNPNSTSCLSSRAIRQAAPPNRRACARRRRSCLCAENRST